MESNWILNARQGGWDEGRFPRLARLIVPIGLYEWLLQIERPSGNAVILTDPRYGFGANSTINVVGNFPYGYLVEPDH